MNTNTRRKRIDDVTARAGQTDHMHAHCRIIGCGLPTTAGTGSGLNKRYCRKHEDHFERHGSYTKTSYRYTELEPHRKAAMQWLKAHKDDPVTRYAIEAVKALYASAGAKVEAFRLRGMTPQDRAKVAWARLREAEVDPVRPLAAWLAIEAMIQADPQRESREEFKQVQAAKLVHRMASGTHKRWQRERSGGRVVVEEMHKYPNSRGRVLRHLGAQLERAAELVTRQFLAGS